MNKSNQKRLLEKIESGLATSLAILLVLIFASLTAGPAMAQDGDSRGGLFGIGGFIDEDGDGFNDLLPDSDGDGVPDIIDPDSRIQLADSLSRHRYTHGRPDSVGGNHHQMGDTLRIRIHDGNGGMFGGHDMFNPDRGGMMPGEPGQYGPGDSTGHGGMHDGRWMDGGHGGWPDSGGMGGGGMGGGKIEPGQPEQNDEAAPHSIAPSPEPKSGDMTGSRKGK